MKKLMLGAILAGAAFAAQTGTGWAYGHAPWCSSADQGGGNYVMFCQYPSAEACAREVISGNRGQCLQNPEFTGYAPPPRRKRVYR